jgi:hypothetical protein
MTRTLQVRNAHVRPVRGYPWRAHRRSSPRLRRPGTGHHHVVAIARVCRDVGGIDGRGTHRRVGPSNAKEGLVAQRSGRWCGDVRRYPSVYPPLTNARAAPSGQSLCLGHFVVRFRRTGSLPNAPATAPAVNTTAAAIVQPVPCALTRRARTATLSKARTAMIGHNPFLNVRRLLSDHRT